MRLIDKVIQASIPLPCKVALGLHHQLFGGDKSARTAEMCIQWLCKNILFQQSHCSEAGLGRSFQPSPTSKSKAFHSCDAIPVSFWFPWLMNLRKGMNGFVWCNLRLPPHIPGKIYLFCPKSMADFREVCGSQLKPKGISGPITLFKTHEQHDVIVNVIVKTLLKQKSCFFRKANNGESYLGEPRGCKRIVNSGAPWWRPRGQGWQTRMKAESSGKQLRSRWKVRFVVPTDLDPWSTGLKCCFVQWPVYLFFFKSCWGVWYSVGMARTYDEHMWSKNIDIYIYI